MFHIFLITLWPLSFLFPQFAPLFLFISLLPPLLPSLWTFLVPFNYYWYSFPAFLLFSLFPFGASTTGWISVVLWNWRWCVLAYLFPATRCELANKFVLLHVCCRSAITAMVLFFLDQVTLLAQQYLGFLSFNTWGYLRTWLLSVLFSFFSIRCLMPVRCYQCINPVFIGLLEIGMCELGENE